jgi:hypothetical protein
MAGGGAAETPDFAGAALGLLISIFFEDFLGLLRALLAAVVFLAAFRAFFASSLLGFFPRFFVAFLVERTREDAPFFFALPFLTVFFLGVATTNSFTASTRMSGLVPRS